MGIKIRRVVYDSKNVGKIMQSMIDAGFTKVKFENNDGSTMVQDDFLFIEAESSNWHNKDVEHEKTNITSGKMFSSCKTCNSSKRSDE